MVSSLAYDNRRQARRFSAHHPAQILLGPEAMIPCTVKDISTGGAKIELKPQMDLPETFELFIAAHDLQVRRARVCWRKDGYAGIAFSLDETEAAQALAAPELSPFEVCLEQAALPTHLAAAPARKRLKIYQTA
jgi:PilZ domain